MHTEDLSRICHRFQTGHVDGNKKVLYYATFFISNCTEIIAKKISNRNARCFDELEHGFCMLAGTSYVITGEKAQNRKLSQNDKDHCFAHQDT